MIDIDLNEAAGGTITAYDAGGSVLWAAEGREFISPDWRVFLSGVSNVTTPLEEYTLDGTPVEFIFPGEPGFLSATPKYGCGAMLSSLER